jgi:2-(1,2-epoxy-1,2-dihydrophenyl)acetyl-CoA isomerase
VAEDYGSVDGLHAELSEGVLTLRLDRPTKRNALDDVMIAGLASAIDLAGRDEMVRVISISATGDHFCSGFDIVERNASGSARRPRVGSIQRRLPSQAHRLVPLMLTVQTPIVCAARGWAAGIGLQLLIASDFAIVADDAKLWEPFLERGMTPDSGVTWLLPRRIGEVRARELLFLGRVLSGSDAAEWGLVHRSVPTAQIDAEAGRLVEQLSKGPTVAAGLTKWLMHTGRGSSLEAQLRDEAFALELSSRSEDFKEGLAAFSAKRTPGFTGR